jgi:hypothetical protein
MLYFTIYLQNYNIGTLFQIHHIDLTSSSQYFLKVERQEVAEVDEATAVVTAGTQVTILAVLRHKVAGQIVTRQNVYFQIVAIEVSHHLLMCRNLIYLCVTRHLRGQKSKYCFDKVLCDSFPQPYILDSADRVNSNLFVHVKCACIFSKSTIYPGGIRSDGLYISSQAETKPQKCIRQRLTQS